MAQNNKIITPNYTQIPNVIIDEWMKILSYSELKVIIYLCRQTFGWHKVKDKISRAQISANTNLTKEGARKALRGLEEKGLVVKKLSFTNLGDHDCNEYEINVIEPLNDQLLSPTPVTTVTEGDQPRLPRVTNHGCLPVTNHGCLHTKEREIKYTKENTNPLPPSKGNVCEFISFGKFVRIAQKEYDELCGKYGTSVINALTEEVNDYLSSTGKKPYKDYAATIRGWIRRRNIPSVAKNNTTPSPTVSPPAPPPTISQINKWAAHRLERYPLFREKRYVISEKYIQNLETKDEAMFDMATYSFLRLMLHIFDINLDNPEELLKDRR